MGKLFQTHRREWVFLLLLGIAWLIWQIFLDELMEIIRSRIPEGGMIMYGITHPYVIMPSLLVILVIYALIRSRARANIDEEDVKEILTHYRKLTDLILQIETASYEQRTGIIADMQRELTDIGDTELDGIMSAYFELLDHEEELGLKPARFNSNIALERIREHMNKKYPRR